MPGFEAKNENIFAGFISIYKNTDFHSNIKAFLF